VDFTSGASLERQALSDFNIISVDVVIPENMPVSTDPNLRYPSPETLVWWEDPPGDRKAQVQQLVADAVRRSADRLLTGTRPVRIEILIDQFHAMTPRARSSSLQLGVHEIRFDVSVLDAETGVVVASESDLNADLQAYSGASALLAEQNGQTQVVRIKDRIDQVMSAWLQS